MLFRVLRNKCFLNNPLKTNFSASARSYGDGPPPSLLRKYEKFQVDNGLPVHLKGGFGDRVLYGITLALIAVGLVDGLSTIYKMAVPKKKK